MSAEKGGKFPHIAVGINSGSTLLKITEKKRNCIISGKALDALKRIQQICPEFEPGKESDIWIKAYRLGLVEE